MKEFAARRAGGIALLRCRARRCRPGRCFRRIGHDNLVSPQGPRLIKAVIGHPHHILRDKAGLVAPMHTGLAPALAFLPRNHPDRSIAQRRTDMHAAGTIGQQTDINRAIMRNSSSGERLDPSHSFSPPGRRASRAGRICASVIPRSLLREGDLTVPVHRLRDNGCLVRIGVWLRGGRQVR